MTYQIAEIPLPLDAKDSALWERAAKRLHLPVRDIVQCRLVRRAVDARRKSHVHFSCTVQVTLRESVRLRPAVLNRDTKIRKVAPYAYQLPESRPLAVQPVVVGLGPAGLFAALTLAQAGQRPIVVERGAPVEERARNVVQFWQTGRLDPSSNVQFGEGGAGTFSDGKLTTGTKDPRIRHVLEEFVQAGAPDCILWEAKPHIGTDKLPGMVACLRKRIEELGGQVHFHTRLVSLDCKDGILRSVTLAEGSGAKWKLPCTHLVLAIGHSARDTFSMLLKQGLCLEQKPFAVGLRIEHLQTQIDRAQYGPAAGHPALGAADYKLAAHLPDGRGVYTFCMCPGGTVVPAASEEGRVVTNGMSNFARDGKNANAALLVGLTPQDFGCSHPLAGIRLQRQLEAAAFAAGGGNFIAPVQRVGDFLEGRASIRLGSVMPTYCRGVHPCDLHACLPDSLTRALADGIRLMGHRLHGFDQPDAVLTAVESRSSSPVRIVRGQDCVAVGHRGIYPCGEGAGYAGGITSAAVDGIRCAEAILSASCEREKK